MDIKLYSNKLSKKKRKKERKRERERKKSKENLQRKFKETVSVIEVVIGDR